MHYENKEDFINTISNEILDEFVMWIKRAQKINSIKSEKFNSNKPKDTLYEMFNFVGENQNFFILCLEKMGQQCLEIKCKKTIKNRVYKELVYSIKLEGHA